MRPSDPSAEGAESKRARIETAAVFATAALHFVFYEWLSLRGVFILVAIGGWLGYVVARIRREPRCIYDFGLSRRGLGPTAIAAGVVLVVGSLLCLGVGLAQGRLTFTTNMLLVAALYPVWGLVQQLLVQAMAVRNLVRWLPRATVVPLAGLLFGVVHLPHLWLALATAALGAAFTVIYLRWRNIWPLGICHGWLGVLFYAWVLGRDPWLEVVG